MKLKAFLLGLAVGALLGTVAHIVVQQRATQATLAAADSAVAADSAQRAQLARFQQQLDSSRAFADSVVEDAAASKARSAAIARRALRRPAGTASDSARFWEDSASKAQDAFDEALVAATMFEQAFDTVHAALLAARDTIGAQAERQAALVEQLRAVAAVARKPDPVVRPVVGIGLTLAGDVAAFAGVGVDPAQLVRKVLGF